MYRTLMLIAALDGVVFGLGSLLLPDVILTIFGGETNDLGLGITRQLGGIILGYGVVAWFLRALDPGPMRRGVMLGIVISFALTAVTAAVITLSGMINGLGWGIFAIHAAVAIGLLWVLFARDSSE